jgi:hypothetical protein
MKFNQELAKAGALIALDGPHPSSRGACRVCRRQGQSDRRAFHRAERSDWRRLDDPGESEGKRVEWTRRCPASDGDVIEVREVFEMSAFPPDVQKAADNPTARADRKA